LTPARSRGAADENSAAKNEKLKGDRGIGFEEIVFLIGQGHGLDILEHPNQQRYVGQRIFVA
jgi:hypothetical protein